MSCLSHTRYIVLNSGASDATLPTSCLAVMLRLRKPPNGDCDLFSVRALLLGELVVDLVALMVVI
jgi:hypothetical protein